MGRVWKAGERDVDVFSTVLAIVVAGIALFVGYKIGIKDGFRGGVQTGRLLERSHADEERRFLTARLVHAQAELHARAEVPGLPQAAAFQDDAEDRRWPSGMVAEAVEPRTSLPEPKGEPQEW